MASDRRAAVPEGTSAAALYIASLTQELARLAKGYNLETLAYILDIAHLEADEIVKRQNRSGGRGSNEPN